MMLYDPKKAAAEAAEVAGKRYNEWSGKARFDELGRQLPLKPSDGRPANWPLERWFSPDTPLPGRLTSCPRCNATIVGRGIACDGCYAVFDGENYLKKVLSAYGLDYSTAASSGTIIVEMRAYFAALRTVRLPGFEPDYPILNDEDDAVDESQPSLHVVDVDLDGPPAFTLETLTYLLFKTSSGIKRLVQTVSDGKSAEPFFQKAFEKGQADWQAHNKVLESWDGESPIKGEVNSIEGRAYFRALDRAEQIFEFLTPL